MANPENLKPFKKGQSGNPGGRSKVIRDVQNLAREYTQEALETLAAIMKDCSASPSARVSAANAILDRGYGRPAQSLHMDVPSRPLVEYTDAELAAMIQECEEDEDPTASH